MSRKVRILGIAPYRGLVTQMEQCALQYQDIEFKAVLGNMDKGLELARILYKDYDIIISRANTADMISQAVPIPVIDIGIDYYDVLRCIKIAENTHTKFAILGFYSLTTIAKNLCDLLRLSVDIFSFSANMAQDADQLLENLKEMGYKTVICDMIPYHQARMMGITPILLTSSVESLKNAIHTAVTTWTKHQELCQSLSMMRSLLNHNSDSYLVLDMDGVCQYSTLQEEAEAITEKLREELPKSSRGRKRSFFITLNEQMYSVVSELSDDSASVIFRIMRSKIPLSHSKYGITIVDKQSAMLNFMESFYSNTEHVRKIVDNTGDLASGGSCLMITGETGTGKDQIAYLHYVKSNLCDNPLYVINCTLLNEKAWNFITNSYNSPFMDNNNTIYIANLDSLPVAKHKRLLSIIVDTNLHIRNRMIFSCTQPRDHSLPHVALEYANMLGCISVRVRPLREQKREIAETASFYINTLNQSLGTQVVGLDEDAVRILEEYDYPSNRTQLKRILKKAILKTRTPYVAAETVTNILLEESAYLSESQAVTQDNKDFQSEFHLDLNQSLADMNYEIVLHVLKCCNNNHSAAAQKLGISRTTLWRYLNAGTGRKK